MHQLLRILLICLSLTKVSTSFSQNLDAVQLHKADSIQKLLDRATKDTSRVMLASELSRVLQTINQKQRGLTMAIEANALAKKIQFKRGLASTFASIGNAYRELGRLEESTEALVKSAEYCRSARYRREEGFVYHNLGQIFWAQGDTTGAIRCHYKALEINKEINVLNRQGFAHDFLGYLFVQKGENKEALKHYKASLRVFTELKIAHRIALSAGNVGMVNLWLGNNDEALKYFIVAVKNYELENNTKGILWIYGLISNVYRGIADYENAMKYNHLLLNLYQKVDSIRGTADAYQLIGETLLQKRELEKSRENIDRAITIYNQVNYAPGIYGSLLTLGEWYWVKGEYMKALNVIEEVLYTKGEAPSKSNIADARKWRGLLLVHLNKPIEAKQELNLALDYYQKAGFKKNFAPIYEYLAKADSAVGNYEAAYNNYKLYIQSKSADMATLSVTEKMALKFEFEKREALAKAELRTRNIQRNAAILGFSLSVVILLLIIYFFRLRRKNLDVEKENILLQKREIDRIRETESFKSRFLTNISHEFRTPLTLIRGHLELMEDQVTDSNLERVKEMQNNSELLLQLINQLLDLAKMESGTYRLYFEKGYVLSEIKSFYNSFQS